METLNPTSDTEQRAASPPLEELLDEATGGQSEPPATTANQNGGNELELGHIAESPTNQSEVSHVSENITNHRLEGHVNEEQEDERGMFMIFLSFVVYCRIRYLSEAKIHKCFCQKKFAGINVQENQNITSKCVCP